MPAALIPDAPAQTTTVAADAAELDSSALSHTGIHEGMVEAVPLGYRESSSHAVMPSSCDMDASTVPASAAALSTPTSSSYHASSGRVSTQLSQTMDGIEGHSIMLLGASSESDPWLLRHCQFDQLGLRSVHKMYFRNAGGVPTTDKIPIHFIVSDNKYLNHPLLPMYHPIGGDARLQLSQLVQPTYGVRLISLFRKYVYPTLPVVPSTYMDIPSTNSAASPVMSAALDSIPTSVLAAMYGLAMPFALNDELLAVVNAFETPPLLQLWTLVHSLIQVDIHRPSLSTVQAALLFLHKDSNSHTASNSSGGNDLSSSAFLWSFIGSTVGMAHSLGLQFECQMFGIPNADKRLRRRLWWALYIEEKWQSLLMGRPPYIRADEWDVGELCDNDFETKKASSYFDEAAAVVGRTFLPFRDMARLAVIVADVQERLYSLRACQRLGEDLAQSISTAKPLFDRLNDWRSSISAPEPFDDNVVEASPYPTTMYFAYLTIVTYVWRALLRPTVRSSPPPRIIDVEEEPPLQDAGGFFFEELSWDFSDLPEIELHLEEDIHAHGEASATIKELHQAAQAFGGTVATFTSRLTSRHFDEFWYSWSRIGFAVISNFLTVLLVQAPTAENAPRAKWMLESWRQTLRYQSKAFPILRLAMARLNAFYWGGLAETFCLPPHVQEVVT
ncbi:hypothetical protein LMH87_003111 [Akanthomyces muscarius]|uniref:Xylanolytic transcriptional activator regulatory domain-containing protein n=1 Tax=Akanthomyces muscarius TaxID=2231603 RepID=A0A9W8Q2N4_AKAMU|nr:hypothetical protein LMH87_003111 [Akanthomyces muscarius]KAJ4144221.1 hypothetical protein LMH87_003111 [Akanthomyces muscarius]